MRMPASSSVRRSVQEREKEREREGEREIERKSERASERERVMGAERERAQSVPSCQWQKNLMLPNNNKRIRSTTHVQYTYHIHPQAWKNTPF